jgi:hypothetical protein
LKNKETQRQKKEARLQGTLIRLIVDGRAHMCVEDIIHLFGIRRAANEEAPQSPQPVRPGPRQATLQFEVVDED